MKPDIPVFSPPQLRNKYLLDGQVLKNRLIGDISLFSILRIEEVSPYLMLPNDPFRNTANGFILVTSGSVIMNVDVTVQSINQDMLILNPAGQVNSIWKIEAETTGFMVIFHEHFFDNSQLSFGLKNFSELLNPENLLVFNLKGGLKEMLQSICERMAMLHYQPENHLFQIKHYLLTILSELRLAYQEKTKSINKHTSSLIANFKRDLLENIKNNPKPAEIAERLSVSTNHLNKVLKYNTSLTTSQWIARRQVIEAQLLLRRSDNSIAEIAHRLGFEDPSYFSKFFQKHTQVTPSEYRRG